MVPKASLLGHLKVQNQATLPSIVRDKPLSVSFNGNPEGPIGIDQNAFAPRFVVASSVCRNRFANR